MSSWPSRRLALAVALGVLLSFGAARGQSGAWPSSSAFPGIGRSATPKEVAAWDIDVRPDFKGLPKGSGSVAKGMLVWEGKCASCHGVFGESNEVFSPVVGGTTQDDLRTGRVARLNDASFPGRTTLMKLSTVSTLWDYIRRAMPWAQPKSLSTEEVYAVTAYILNLGGIVADDFVLSDANMGEVQQRLPNRNGMTTEHALWPGRGLGRRAPDVKAVACMKDCGPVPVVASFLPDFARNAHGNLQAQNRTVGAQRGAETAQPALTPPAPDAAAGAAAAIALTQKYSCTACHGLDSKLVGPSFRDIGKKHATRSDGVDYMAGKIQAGGAGVWGAIPMPPQSIAESDARTIAQWLSSGARN
ncbi:MAG: c-type cytochrome [Burkholderiaceae bacterium]